MNENINLCEILKGCEGIELYSSLHGVVTFKEIHYYNNAEPTIIVQKENNGFIEYYKDGKYYSTYKDAECVLFPSKDQRDWSKFQRPIKKGTPMMCSCGNTNQWELRYYSHYGYNESFKKWEHYVFDYYNSKWHKPYPIRYDKVIPFEEFNPNDIKESLKYNIQK